jgi:hypothetical protein
MEFELRVQSRCSTTWATPPGHFALVILEVRSYKLFTWAGLEQKSSQSQPPNLARITGVSHWRLAWKFYNAPVGKGSDFYNKQEIWTQIVDKDKW